MSGPTRNPVVRANQLLDARSTQAAMGLLSAYLATHPDDPGALESLSRALTQLERHAEAIEVAERVIALAPHRAYAWHVLSVAATNVGRHSKAVHAAITARTLEPHNAVLHAHVVFATVASGAATGKTVKDAKRAVELSPHSVLSYRALGRAYASQGRQHAASRAYGHALRLDPSDSDVLHDLAGVHFSRGKLGTSVRALGEVLAADPTNDHARRAARSFADVILVFVLLGLWVYVGVLGFANMWSAPQGQPLPSSGGGLPYATTATRVGLAGGLTVSILVYLLWFRMSAGRRFGRVVRALYSWDRLQVVWTAMLAATYVSLVATTVASSTLSTVIFSLAIVLLVATSLLRLTMSFLER